MSHKFAKKFSKKKLHAEKFLPVLTASLHRFSQKIFFKKWNFLEIEFPKHLTQFPFKLHMWISWEEDIKRPLDLAETKEAFSHLKKVSLFGIFLQSNLHVLQPFLSIHFPWKKHLLFQSTKWFVFFNLKQFYCLDK